MNDGEPANAPAKGTAVVAGATGYAGGHVAGALHDRGWTVRALVRDPDRLGAAAASFDEVFVGQATRAETLTGLFDDADVAFSSIGIRTLRRRPSFMAVDYGANMNLVDAAERAGVRRFVFISVLGGETFRDRNPLIDARERVADRLRSSRMQAVVVRPTGFFDDMDEIFELARRGRVWLVGDGTTRVNPIHGADLADFVADRLEDPDPVPASSIGGPDALTQREIAELAFSALGRPPRISHASLRLLAAASVAARPFSSNAAALIGMFALLGEHDGVGEAIGTRRLVDHYAELADPHRTD